MRLISLAFVILIALCQPLVAATTWNPSDKDSAVTLGAWSGQSNLYAEQSSAASSYRMVRSTTSHSSGKFYFEVVTPLVDTGNQGNLIGVANSSQALNNYVGSTANSLGFKSGAVFGASAGTTCTISNLKPLGIAVDLTNNKIWCTNDGATWSNCNACAAGNPATSATGLSISSVNTGNVFIAWSGQDNASADSVILNVGNFGPFQFAIPSGYSGWDANGTTLINLAGTQKFIPAASGAYDNSGSTSTLSGGNLIATGPTSGIGDWNDIKLTGKRYFEIKWSASAGAYQDFGIASPVLNGATQAGADAYGWSYAFSQAGSGVNKGAVIYNATSFACATGTNATLGIAVDFTLHKIWCTPNGTNWVNGDNPATGTGGMSFSGTIMGYGAVVVISQQGSTAATLNAAGPFTYTVPSGFVGWDAGAVAAAKAMFKSGPGW